MPEMIGSSPAKGDARCYYYVTHSRNAVAEGRRKLLEFKMEFRLPGTSRKPAETP